MNSELIQQCKRMTDMANKIQSNQQYLLKILEIDRELKQVEKQFFVVDLETALDNPSSVDNLTDSKKIQFDLLRLYQNYLLNKRQVFVNRILK